MKKFTLLFVNLFLSCTHAATGGQQIDVVQEDARDSDVAETDNSILDCRDAMMLLQVGNSDEKTDELESLPIPSNQQVTIANPRIYMSKESRTFLPTEQEIESLNSALVMLLNSPDKFASVIHVEEPYYIHEIVKRLKYYYVQYFGEESSERKIVKANFIFQFPKHNCEVPSDEIDKKWKEELIHVKGGGFSYFLVEFDVIERKIIYFRTNSSR